MDLLRAFRAALVERAGRVLPLFAALALLRLELASVLRLSPGEAVHHALGTGLANDLLVAVFVEALAEGVGLELPAESKFFRDVALASRQAIVQDLVAPP